MSWPRSRGSILMFASGLLTCAGAAPAGVSVTPASHQDTEAWLDVSVDGRSFTLVEGTTVEVTGSGRLDFLHGRRTIRVPEGLNPVAEDGVPVPPGLFAGAAVRVLDSARNLTWTVRSVEELPHGPGTRIRDGDSGTASIASSAPVRFFLRVDPSGATEFFHPEARSTFDIRDRIENVLDRYAGYGFSGVVAASLSRDEPPVVAAAGHRAGPGSPPMDERTLFELGSLTKQATAAAVLELEQRGVLSVEDPLARWRPELPARIGAVTLHQLLLHTSGFPEDVDVPEDDVEAVWETIATIDLEAPPGEEWSYSNLGYVALAAVVESAAPDGYRELVAELIRRGGIGDLGFPDGRDEWAGRYAVGGSGPLGTGRITEHWPIEPRGWNERLGASGLVGTISALHDWFRALRAGRVLSPAATERMFEERPPEIAYGWFYLRNGDGSVRIAHGGDTKGFQTYLTHFVAEDVVIAVGINDRRGWRGPVLRALHSVIEEDSMPNLPPPVADELPTVDRVGEYVLPDGSSLRVDTADYRLRLSASGSDAIAMLTGADHALADSLAEISRDAKAFLHRLLRGDTVAVEADLASSGRAESFWRIWIHLMADHAEPPRHFRILGTIPDRAQRLVTFVRLSFADGEETLRLVWRPHLDGWGTGGNLPARDYWPVGAERFVSFDPTRSGWVELRFEESGSTTALVDRAGRRAIRSRGTSAADLALPFAVR